MGIEMDKDHIAKLYKQIDAWEEKFKNAKREVLEGLEKFYNKTRRKEKPWSLLVLEITRQLKELEE